ncbi:helix-turn-helix transcriptional regulator [Bacillus halotolerans]|uniref:helix-turn-helix transcriptional regulator n=1 Tax=Bacillus subtilis group TaxID=653685 RepID=UPI00100A1D5F|nr:MULTISPECIES: helix-turn-helix domain-containing protein [Bacillus subtilis group]MCY7813483.1 helix-turn-helix domain-containing protein [Bacillus spizizenii]MBV5122211.1 helix-turn-helix domain-containing protein [Bacillus halotolerans]MCC2528225.1 helix-turn-helix domain-containing protein [Bacillus halotolerans]MCT6511953.1 helix-turn-helix domain-containing protein [Bacillus subtilis]MCY8051771.1 helix-turn-helix domain-containing protein [Bacillus spizizenii]
MYLNLFVARKEKRKSQREIAEVLKISPQTYHLKESGKSDFLLAEARVLAQLFERSIDDLFKVS